MSDLERAERELKAIVDELADLDEWGWLCEKTDRYERALLKVAAEKQRAFKGPSMTMAGRTMAPLDMVADLIDPEVKTGD